MTRTRGRRAPDAGGAARRVVASVAAGMAELMWPTRCVGCDAPGTLLCDDCRAALRPIDQAEACPRCGAPFGRIVCTECSGCFTRNLDEGLTAPAADGSDADDPFRDLDGTCCYGVHAWPLSDVIRAYKDGDERRLAALLGEMLAVAACGSRAFDPALLTGVTFVPSTPTAYARRGFDHMHPVAARAARLLGLPLRDVLARGTAVDQRTLTRADRIRNARGDCVALESLRGERLLLVDDVLTTGATLRGAALACRAAGAATVSAATVARAW